MVLLACGLPREEFEVRVCTLTRDGPLVEDLQRAGIPVTSIGKKWKIDPWAFARLKSCIREFRPDLVHTWIFAANSYGRKAAVQCGVPKIVAAERCLDPWKSRYHFKIDRELAKKTDRIFTNSSGVRDFYAEKGFDPRLFTIIPNGIVIPESLGKKGDMRERLQLLHELDIPSVGEPYVLGLIARLWPQKRIKDAIWACETLKFSKLNFHCLVFGDGPERERLLRYRAQLRCSDRVHFLGHRNDIARFLPHFDLLWCTSEYEGQSNAILEAMGAGIPVIASDISGNRDLLVPGETGILVPEFGSDFRRRRSQFVEQSLRLLKDPQKREQMGKAAQKRIAEHFSVEKMIERYAQNYRELLNR